mmetsp:Transcript_70228/g.156443  ORF Transcript_70228/g.156443 Transcript_70228/m.156443 type:complete len:235 (+) Transcript_70228:1985-2689(+)
MYLLMSVFLYINVQSVVYVCRNYHSHLSVRRQKPIYQAHAVAKQSSDILYGMPVQVRGSPDVDTNRPNPKWIPPALCRYQLPPTRSGCGYPPPDADTDADTIPSARCGDAVVSSVPDAEMTRISSTRRIQTDPVALSTFYCALRSARRAWLGVTVLVCSASPVSGEVLLCASHCSMAVRSKVCPSAVQTGSAMRVLRIGHRNSSASDRLRFAVLLALTPSRLRLRLRVRGSVAS